MNWILALIGIFVALAAVVCLIIECLPDFPERPDD